MLIQFSPTSPLSLFKNKESGETRENNIKNLSV
jgi:hypothetical protein